MHCLKIIICIYFLNDGFILLRSCDNYGNPRILFEDKGEIHNDLMMK